MSVCNCQKYVAQCYVQTRGDRVRSVGHLLHLPPQCLRSCSDVKILDIRSSSAESPAKSDVFQAARNWNTGEIPHIPIDVAVPFVLDAVRWVREHGPEIATALEQAEAAYASAAMSGKGANACEIAAVRTLRTFRFEHPPVLDGQLSPEFLTGLLQLRRLVRMAVTAGFIVVAALTGMRLSELLGLEEDCLEPVPLEDGSDDNLLYVRGVLVKTAGTPHGEGVRWVRASTGPTTMCVPPSNCFVASRRDSGSTR